MGTTPQPPRPPVPPPEPRAGSNVVAIVLLVLALIVVVCGLTLYTGVKFLSHNVQLQVDKSDDGKDVSVKTPVGTFEAHKNSDVNEASLGLPIYPGAQQVNDQDSAGLSMQFPGEQKLKLTVAKFETGDDFDKVEKFYQDRIGGEVTKFTQKDKDGKTVFEIKHKDEDKVVALRSLLTGTRIELVHVLHGANDVN